MSTGHSVCFKHLKRNCSCTSDKKLLMHHSFRVPPDGKLNDWKEAIKYLASCKNPYLKEQLDIVMPGTRLEDYYNRIK